MAMRVDMPRGAAILPVRPKARCICGMPVVEQDEDGRWFRCARGCKWRRVGDGADRRRDQEDGP